MLIWITDAHFDPNDPNGKQITYEGHTFSQRLLDKIGLYRQAVDYAIANNAKYFVDAGDTTNQLNPPEWFREMFKNEILLPLIENKIHIYFIAGNHGSDKVSTAFKSFNNFNLYFHFVDSPQVIDDFILLPFFAQKDQKLLIEILENIKPGYKIITHLPIQGAMGDSGHIMDGFGLLLFKAFPKVYSGHFHRPQNLGNITYLGSMATNKWDEIYNKHYFGVYNYETKKMSCVELKDRLFIKIEDYHDVNSYSDFTDAVVQLEVTGTKAEIMKFPKNDVIKQIYDKGAYLVKYSPKVVNGNNDTKFNPVSPVENLIKEYAKNDPTKITIANQLLYRE